MHKNSIIERQQKQAPIRKQKNEIKQIDEKNGGGGKRKKKK